MRDAAVARDKDRRPAGVLAREVFAKYRVGVEGTEEGHERFEIPLTGDQFGSSVEKAESTPPFQ